MNATAAALRLSAMRMLSVVGQTWLGTEAMPDLDPAALPAQRSHRCYELAAAAVCLGTAGSDSILIHGTICGPEPTAVRIGHAWVLLGNGTVWEPYLGDVFANEASWNAYAQALPEQKYGRMAALRLTLVEEHWGPWHETKGRTL